MENNVGLEVVNANIHASVAIEGLLLFHFRLVFFGIYTMPAVAPKSYSGKSERSVSLHCLGVATSDAILVHQLA